MIKRGMTGKLFPFSATLYALVAFAPSLQAQEQAESQRERPQLDPSWTDAPQSEDDEGAEPEAQSSPDPAAPPNRASPLPPPLPPPMLPPPIPWAEDPWFRVELSGDDPALRFQIYSLAKEADKKVPIHGCRNPCRVMLPRGEYRVRVSGRPEQIEGDRKLEVTADTRARFTLPDRGAKTGGLALGIIGSALAAVGIMVVFLSSWGSHCGDSCAGDGSDDRKPVSLYVGVSMVIVGAVLTPVGWAQFARNRKPGIEQRPLRDATRAKAPRIGIGAAPIAGGAAAGLWASF
jgi:hypothetical protein